MTNMPASPPRTFNALNGAEVRHRIVQEVERRLAEDTRLGAHLVFPVVTWTWTLELDTYPAAGLVGAKKGEKGDDGVLRTEVRGRVTVTDDGPGSRAQVEAPVGSRPSALADPRGGRLEEEAARSARLFRGDREGERSGVEPIAPDRRSGAAASVSPAVEMRLGRLESLIGDLVTQLGSRGAPAPPVPPGPEAGGPAPPDPSAFHPDVQMHTGTGLAITGGARPSPGPGLANSFGGGSAVGAVQTAAAADRLTYGVQHPPLDQGGVGAPDAVRREAGLPIPQMQSTAGGLVELPAGSF